MSTRKKSNNFIQRIFKQIWRFFDVATKAVFNRLLRSLLVLKRQSRLSRAGFVLPTVVMVILVVILLTTAIMIRSFDRSKNASNVRVDQAVLKAATPALDRARAKIDRLFSPDETELQGNTPPEANIASVLEQEKYKLGDETQIELTGDFGGKTPADTAAKTLKSAWKFPVDTDNNGKFDTYTLYGIYFRNPRAASNNENNRARGTTEARALPQNDGQGERCATGGAGGIEGWTLIGGQLKKAFFTYVANVPITDTTGLDNKYEKYTGNKGFSALEMQLDQARVSLDNNAVWYKDDISINSIPSLRLNGRVYTSSNLLVSNPDGNPINFLQVSSPESCFYNPANAKIIVGGNVAANDIGSSDSSSSTVKVDLYKGKGIDPRPTQQVINADNKTTTMLPSDVAGNSDAYAQRINVLVQGAINLHDENNDPGFPTIASVQSMAGRYPKEVIEAFNKKFDANNPGSGLNALKQSLETYFANRIRRVSFAEIPITAPPEDALKDGTAIQSAAIQAPTGTTFVFSGGGEIMPPTQWMLIQDASGSPNAYTKLPLNFANGGLNMPATDPGTATGAAATTRVEQLIGDRIQVGNNLPNRWLKSSSPVTYAAKGETQPVVNGGSPVNWNNGGGQRQRKGVVEQLDDIGDTSRNGFWEIAAAKLPPLEEDPLAGGLRVVTGAGIYIDGTIGNNGTGKRISDPAPNPSPRSFLPEPTLDSYFASAIDPATGVEDPLKKQALQAALPPNPTVVWPDSMPMYQWKDRFNPATRKAFGSPGKPEQYKGDLQMRATVVYHYKNGDDPLACISSYYDPTDSDTAKNTVDDPNKGMSNNGISYQPPGAGQRVETPRLRRQSQMVFPDGRWVNKPLYDALIHVRRGTTLSLADKAAFDSANCALSILDGAAATGSPVPDGAIKERAFLDARQVKTVHKIATEVDNATLIVANTLLADLNNPDHLKMAPLGALTKDYTLPLEQRQPLEVRVTEIDLGQLKAVSIDDDYLLPNSGIIYATRDDALPDLSASQTPSNGRPLEIRNKKNTPSETAATDFKLDPTRRPNGIRLINGSNLARVSQYRAAEKGLIFASDLPVYVKGEFNVHGSGGNTLEEFQEKLAVDGNNFYTRSTPEQNFACRAGAPSGCGSTGDQWRAARILSDAITLLSDKFRDGYRTEGDYDLRNNAGNLAVESYLDNGFWMNNFATTAKWYDDTTGLPRANLPAQDGGSSGGSSYVMNGITPVQRRVNFPAYKMEICTKLPASECGAQDWKGGSLVPPTGLTPAELRAWNKEARQAGTTAPAATPPTALDAQYISEHYPRRVAFQRDLEFGQLVLDETANHAQPLKPGGAATYGAPGQAGSPPVSQPNSLWFATTTNNSDPSAAPSYKDKTKLLYYAADEPETGTATKPVHERQLLLPGTPAFPKELQTIPAFAGQTVLNGLNDTDPSDFAVCNLSGTSNLYKTPAPLAPTPPGTPVCDTARATVMLTALKALKTPTGDQAKVLSVQTLDATVAPDLVTGLLALPATATKKVNVFDLTLPPKGPGTPRFPNRKLANVTLTLDGSTQSDPIFIFRGPPPPGIGMKLENVQLVLKGVDPNNIFWVAQNGGITIATGAAPSKLTGNFLGTGLLEIQDASNVKAGRFLGFRNTKLIAGTLTALTTTAQPLVVPVVQLHSPNGQPDAATVAPLNQDWLQKATPTTFNAVFVMGDSPARPVTDSSNAVVGAESNGGLGNFPRFLEAWGKTVTTGLKAAKISGGFIQFKRSAVATAPFEAVTDPTTDTALFLDTSAKPTLSTQGDSDYLYRGGASGSKAPYYMPPERNWGYDVGLLSQTPDLFSRRFAIPEAQTPNEFFREVSRDDNWVKTLLCGTTIDSLGNPGVPVLPTGQRPANCP
jgi:type II secretory pathway pseudopilin PulG